MVAAERDALDAVGWVPAGKVLQHTAGIGAAVDIVAEIDDEGAACAGAGDILPDPVFQRDQRRVTAVDVADRIDRRAGRIEGEARPSLLGHVIGGRLPENLSEEGEHVRRG